MKRAILSRSLAVALLVIVALLVWFIMINSLAGRLAKNRAILIDKAALLERWEAKAIALGHQPLTRQVSLRDFQKYYVTGSNAALALANLQAQIRPILARHKMTLRSAQSLPVRNVEGRKQLGLRLQMSGTLQSIRQVLHAFETRQPYLFVDKLHLQAPNLRSIPQRSGEVQLQPQITASAEIFAFSWPEEVLGEEKRER